ncbi:MAG: hypothetical protein Q9179_000223 [Wetmoreana sp. 5 TL-2023]
MVRFIGGWSIFLFLQLLFQISALPTTPNHRDYKEANANLLPQRAFRRQYGNVTGSVAATMLSPALLYWHVTALVNGQPVAVMIDTGSSDFWLQGPNAPSPDGSTPGAPMMQSEGQPSWFNITYQTQSNASTSGPVVATEVKLGSLSVPNFGVGVATQLAFGYPLDGFMGLGFKDINTSAQ